MQQIQESKSARIAFIDAMSVVSIIIGKITHLTVASQNEMGICTITVTDPCSLTIQLAKVVSLLLLLLNLESFIWE
jgi:hypothetical protein